MVNNDDYVEVPPTGEYLRSLVNDRLSWSIALSELIDNAFDANAKGVVVEVGKTKGGAFVAIQDDGDGCADLLDMVCLGKSVAHRTTQLGRYGIGAKNAMLWIGGMDSTATIESTRGVTTRSLTCRWKEYAERWRIRRDDMSESVAGVGQRGTTITLEKCIRRWPADGKQLEQLTEDLGYNYSRAIHGGRQIQIRVGRHEPIVLQPWMLPPLIDVVDTTIRVGERNARVYVGIVKDGHANPKPGITYSHGFRVIRKNGPLGCGDYPYANVCGFVELDKSWHLTKNKDDISQHKEELGQAVFVALHAMLLKAHQRGHQIQFAQFDREINTALNEVCGVPEATATREPGKEKPGTVDPVGTGRKVKRAERERSGKAFKRRASRLTLTYGNLGDKGGFGEAAGNKIILNEAHWWIAKMRKEQNRDLVIHTALQLLAGHQYHQPSESPRGQGNLNDIEAGGPAGIEARWLATPVCFDGSLVADEPADGAEQPSNDNTTASDQADTGESGGNR